MFKNLFSKTKSNTDIKGNSLTREDQVEEIINLSENKPVLLFKHSSRCGISAMVLRRFENELLKAEADYGYYLLDILQFRNISMLIQDRFQVLHQSPQLLVVKNGKVISHSSHHAILSENL